MKFLFIHQNFPGQFKHLAPALVQQGHDVMCLTPRVKQPEAWNGVRLEPYTIQRGSTPGVHEWLRDFETKVIRGEACYRKAVELKAQGYRPDAIIAHPGWGESLFLKDVWPEARLGLYCEYFYQSQGADTDFDPEFPFPDGAIRLRLKNLNNFLHLQAVDAGLAPTHWQAGTFPEPFRKRITVAHDGIDTELIRPMFDVTIQIQGPQGSQEPLRLSRADEAVTFVNRNLEPYRGFHVFMRCLPELLRSRPQAQILMVGGDQVSYGSAPDPKIHGAASWKEVYSREVRSHLTDEQWSRVHFLGTLPHPQFIALLQLSRVHVYLTYPFVLSWSLLEAMSAGCAIVASDTAPVREAIADGQTGRLVNFFDGAGLARTVSELLQDPEQAAALGRQARSFAQAHYDLAHVCLPQQLAWAQGLLSAE